MGKGDNGAQHLLTNSKSARASTRARTRSTFGCRTPRLDGVRRGLHRRHGDHRGGHRRRAGDGVQRLAQGAAVPRPPGADRVRAVAERHPARRDRPDTHEGRPRRRHLPSQIRYMSTSDTEVMYSSLFVCLSACSLATFRKKKSEGICTKFSGKVGNWSVNM